MGWQHGNTAQGGFHPQAAPLAGKWAAAERQLGRHWHRVGICEPGIWLRKRHPQGWHRAHLKHGVRRTALLLAGIAAAEAADREVVGARVSGIV